MMICYIYNIIPKNRDIEKRAIATCFFLKILNKKEAGTINLKVSALTRLEEHVAIHKRGINVPVLSDIRIVIKYIQLKKVEPRTHSKKRNSEINPNM